jgi:hypothetical protein
MMDRIDVLPAFDLPINNTFFFILAVCSKRGFTDQPLAHRIRINGFGKSQQKNELDDKRMLQNRMHFKLLSDFPIKENREGRLHNFKIHKKAKPERLWGASWLAAVQFGQLVIKTTAKLKAFVVLCFSVHCAKMYVRG